MPVRGPSLSQIARLAGVSKTTAVRVLRSEDQSHRIPPDTQGRVRTAAQQLGWQPPRRLVAVRPMVALLGLQRMGTGMNVYLELTSYLSAELDRRGADLLLVPLRDSLAEWRELKRERQVIGAILPNWMLPELEIATRLGVPAVLLNLGSDLPVDSVETDDAGGMALAVDHLHGLGHRRLLWIEPPGKANPHESVVRRGEALRRISAERGLTLTTASERDDLSQLLHGAHAPTGIITYSDYQVPRVLADIHRAGLRLSQDLSLISPGHAELLGWLDPPVTTIEVPMTAMSEAAVRLVMDRAQGTFTGEPQRLRIPQRLLVRGTTGPVRPGG